MSIYHVPVMLPQVLEYLVVKKGQWYIDANLGGGGHSRGVLKAGGKVLGIDLDPDAIREVAKYNNLKVETTDDYLQVTSDRLILYQSNFSQLKKVADKFLHKKVAGILFDLGVSTYQLEKPERGFSFNIKAPVDMRMDQTHQTVTATDLINGLHEKELAELFFKYGEERAAKPIAKKIVEARQQHPITTTNELAKIILSVRCRTRGDRTHPATQVFQALRIAVNDELNNLRESLPQALDALAPYGRLVVISFHSLEDRIVKNFFLDEQKKGSIKIITQKPIMASKEETINNPRSRSGKLRAAEKF